ncbi:unnamed protein product [Arctia plantaginis]|uniref:Cyclase n=1 Tax=Arctia plantaginis TaxID=874455 RepID=A0A8S0ZQX2_ARCPL|nr:unnamed protein product [Arctia plantaginis]
MASVTVALITISCLLTPTIISASGDSLQDLISSGNYEFIDLSHAFNNLTSSFPGILKFKFIKKSVNPSGDKSAWYAANDFETGEHAGTHIDAPYHFYEQGKYVGDLPLERLIVSLRVADVTSKVNGNADYVLYKKDLDNLLNETFDKPCVLLFKFGWSQYFNDAQKYFGFDGTKAKFPGLSTEVAEWIITNKNILGVGVDSPSVDPGPSTDFAVHRILSRAGLYNLENVNVHGQINEKKCTALVLPMKIEHGTGAPVRLVAVCPKVTL